MIKLKPLLKPLFFALKLLLTGYILWRIFARIAFVDVLQSILELPTWLILFLILSSVLRHLIQYQNWRFSLQLNPFYRENKRDVLTSYLIGLPLRFLIPGGSASMGKVLFVDNSSRHASLFSFGAERAFQTWATWTFALAAGLFYFGGSALVWVLVGFAVIALAPLWAYGIFGLFEKSRVLMDGYRQKAPKIASLQLFGALIMHLQYWLILRQSGVIPLFQSLMRMSLTNFANSIPVTVAGLGLRESFAIHFLADAGFNPAQAVAATLTLFIFQDILPGIAGAFVLLSAKRKTY
ncbi:MAG: lysylphosphatidylglycerol synthase domain-containing protein [Candidatus Cloacimonadaceae bacterium]|nr:lysylphosphatidylglycerol synthase domain-containing protein [Candidatus Cloacimonadaceae bacterium]MDP3114972.1 lysylphosphatidylglycerol synthase domain-containing protein [Candidatus Cloacimonadaceae bacterium]